MAALTSGAKALRAQLEEAVIAEVARVGLGAFNRKKVLQPFLAASGKQSTLCRWVDDILSSGKPTDASAGKPTDASARAIGGRGCPCRPHLRTGKRGCSGVGGRTSRSTEARACGHSRRYLDH